MLWCGGGVGVEFIFSHQKLGFRLHVNYEMLRKLFEKLVKHSLPPHQQSATYTGNIQTNKHMFWHSYVVWDMKEMSNFIQNLKKTSSILPNIGKTSAPIGAWTWNFTRFKEILTNRPTDSPTNRQTVNFTSNKYWGGIAVSGKLLGDFELKGLIDCFIYLLW